MYCIIQPLWGFADIGAFGDSGRGGGGGAKNFVSIVNFKIKQNIWGNRNAPISMKHCEEILVQNKCEVTSVVVFCCSRGKF